MMMNITTQNCFYYVPKERIANLLNLPSTYNPEGYIVCVFNPLTEIALFDHPVPEYAIQPDAQPYIGKMGTRAEIRVEDVSAQGLLYLLKIRMEIDKLLKQFEI